MWLKNLIKFSMFLLIVYFIWNMVFSYLWTDENSIKQFYDEPKNSLDVVYIGSSNAYTSFNTVYAYNKYGFVTGMLSSDSQPFNALKYLIKESEKYQNPNVYVIDLVMSTSDSQHVEEGAIRKVIDAMPQSINRIQMADEMVKETSTIKNEDLPFYYFSFFTYHDTWKYIEDFDMKNRSLYKGFLLSSSTLISSPQSQPKWPDEVAKEIGELQTKELDKLLEYIKGEKLKVLFVMPIICTGYEMMTKYNKVFEIIEQNGFEVINMNTLTDKINFDYEKDMYNGYHLNVYGATKFTDYLGNYLDDNYLLSDHRNDINYNTWNSEYQRFTIDYEKLFNEKEGVNYE